MKEEKRVLVGRGDLEIAMNYWNVRVPLKNFIKSINQTAFVKCCDERSNTMPAKLMSRLSMDRYSCMGTYLESSNDNTEKQTIPLCTLLNLFHRRKRQACPGCIRTV